MNMNAIHNLHDIDSRLAGQYRLKAILRPVEGRVGWTRFSVYLEDGKGGITSSESRGGALVPAPVMEAIHSRGGKGVRAWIEVDSYTPVIHFNDKVSGPRLLDLSGTKTERDMMRVLADTVAPGGHLMFAYETARGNAFYMETQECLRGNIPPVCTPLGKLLFDAGFRLVKDWYLSEGGFEGQRKLWGEKPADDAASRLFDRMTFFRVLAYCSAEPRGDLIDVELSSRQSAAKVLAELRLEHYLSDLAEGVALIYRDCGTKEKMELSAHRTCRLIGAFISRGVADDADMAELKKLCRECSRGTAEVMSV